MKVFDQVHGAVLQDLVDVLDLPVGDHGLGLGALELECAVADTGCVQHLRGFILELELVGKPGGAEIGCGLDAVGRVAAGGVGAEA